MGSKEFVFVFFLCFLNSSISNDASQHPGRCKNPECSVPIASGITNLKYPTNQKNGLSFNAGVYVDIYVREYGEKKDMYGIEIDKKRGYVRTTLIKETSVMEKDLVPANPGSFLEATNTVTMGTQTESSSSQETIATNTPTSSALESHAVDSVLVLSSQLPPSSSPFSPSSPPSTNQEQFVATKTSTIDVQSTNYMPPPFPPTEGSAPGTGSSNFQNADSTSTNTKALNMASPAVSSSLDHSSISPSFSSSVEGSESSSSSSESEIAKMSTSIIASVKKKQVDESIKKALDTVAQFSSDEFDDYKATMALFHKQGWNTSEADFGGDDATKVSVAPTETGMQFSTPTAKVPEQYNILNHNRDKILSQSTGTGSSTTKTKDSNKSPELHSANSDNGKFSRLSGSAESVGGHTKNPNAEKAVEDAKTDLNKESDDNVANEIAPEDDGDGDDLDENEDEEDDEEDDAAEDSNHESDITKEESTDNQNEPTTSEPIETSTGSSETTMSESNKVTTGSSETTISEPDKTTTDTTETTISEPDKATTETKISEPDKAITVLPEATPEPDKATSDLTDTTLSEPGEATTDLPETTTYEPKETTKNSTLNDTAEDTQGNANANNNNGITKTIVEESDLKNIDILTKEYNTQKNLNDTAGDKAKSEFGEFNSSTDIPTPPIRHILSDGDSTPTDVVEPDNLGKIDNSLEPQDSALDSGESKTEESSEISSVFSFIYLYEIFINSMTAVSQGIDTVVYWIPEPVHEYIDNANISSRAVVFTGIVAFPCALLFFATYFLKERSKEQELTDLLRETEHLLYLAATERNILREETKTLKEQLTTADDALDQEQNTTLEVQQQLAEMKTINKDVSSEHLVNLDLIQELQGKEESNRKCIKELEGSMDMLASEKEYVSSQFAEAVETIRCLTQESERLKEDIESLRTEKDYNEGIMSETEEQNQKQITKLEQSCGQLLQEAVDWNTRVNELTDQLYSHVSLKEELENSLASKDSEITALKTALSNVEALQNSEDDINDNKTLENKIKVLMDVSTVQNELKKTEEMRDSLADRLQQEKNKVVQLEVDIMELKSGEEKMKLNYNQALQDKTEAQTKLDVLTKYFKDKELQLQRELGVQEAVRQRREEDATSAERQVLLIDKENESYKYQVATLKQEIEETERNLKNQIAAQEKKAHENWLAARAAERKVEDMKQETTTLRQRLTLLEREQENWLNTSHSDIVRPVPQRLSDGHDLFGSHEGSISSDYMPRHLPPPPPPPLLDDLPLLPPPPGRPMMPPPSRFMMPPFMPPFDPSMPLPPHRPQPWRYDADRRNTPSDYEHSLPRKHRTPPYHDGDRRSSSPVDGSSRSRGSSPHERLPDFHNLPPPMPRHMEFHPPGPRFIPPMTSSRIHKGLSTPPRPGNKSMGSTNSHRPGSDDYRRPHPDADV